MGAYCRGKDPAACGDPQTTLARLGVADLAEPPLLGAVRRREAARGAGAGAHAAGAAPAARRAGLGARRLAPAAALRPAQGAQRRRDHGAVRPARPQSGPALLRQAAGAERRGGGGVRAARRGAAARDPRRRVRRARLPASARRADVSDVLAAAARRAPRPRASGLRRRAPAPGLMRELVDAGYDVTAGVLNALDTDEETGRELGLSDGRRGAVLARSATRRMPRTSS